MRIPVQMFLEEGGRYANLIAKPEGGIEFTVAKIDRRLLNGEFAVIVIDADDGMNKPAPEPEVAGRSRRRS